MNKYLLPILLLIGMQSAFAQQSQISGTVTKTNGNPIEFVNVALKEKTLGQLLTKTDSTLFPILLPVDIH